MTGLTYRYVALTDTGLRRTANQDSGYASGRLLVLADGMGGAAAGDLASSETLHILRQLDRDLEVDAGTALEHAVARANERLRELIADDPAVEGMGTTLEALLWDGERFAWAHLGDSRAYRLREGVLEQLSTDHTFVQSLVEEGKITPEEAHVHPHRSLLLRALLGRDDNAADLSTIEPRLGDRYLLCSDGLSDMVSATAIEQGLGLETIDMAAVELVRLALEAGGYDNVTVVIAEMVEKNADPDPHLSSADGAPQLVGAAAEDARPRTGAGAAGTDASLDLDPEELRYAPVEPSRWRWLRWALVTLVVLALAGGAALYAYNWSQKQYFVAEHEGHVTIFRGVQADIPGITLQHVEQTSDIELSSLPEFRRQQVEDGIEASSRKDADEIVKELQRFATPADDAPAPASPSPSQRDDAAGDRLTQVVFAP